MAADDLDKLIQESEDALKRLDAMQKKKPFLQRVKIHLQRNNANLINILLAGSVLAVALGRLGQKQEYQAAREEWEEQQRRLEEEKQRAEARSAALLSSTETLVQGLEAAAAGRSSRDLPHLVLQQLADWRQREQLQQLGLSAAAAAAAAAAAPLPAADADPSSSVEDGSAGDGGSKLML